MLSTIISSLITVFVTSPSLLASSHRVDWAEETPALPSLGDNFRISRQVSFSTMEDDLFQLSFPSSLQPLAIEAWKLLHEAHASLTVELMWTPKDPIHVVILDNTDLANGLASTIGRLGIVLYAVPPEPRFATTASDDWLRLLIFHEFTHYVNMDALSFPWTLLQPIFGDFIKPNSLWPTTLLEGLAVYKETRHTQQGRGRGSFYKMLRRAWVYNPEQRSLDLSQLSLSYPIRPAGDGVYLFGYSLWNEVRLQQESLRPNSGDSLIGQLSLESAGRVPYFWSGQLENHIDLSWDDLWNRAWKRMQSEEQPEIQELLTKGVTRGDYFGEALTSVYGAGVHPKSGELFTIAESLDKRTQLKTYRPNQETSICPKIAQNEAFGSAIRFNADGRLAVYSSLEASGLFNRTLSIKLLDIENSCQTTELTHPEDRMRDPSITASGEELCAFQNTGLHTALRCGKLNRENDQWTWTPEAPIAKSKDLDRWSHLAFSPSGNRLTWIELSRGTVGTRLWVWNRDTAGIWHPEQSLYSAGHYWQWPQFINNDEIIVNFDQSKTDQIVKINLKNKNVYSLTENITGAWIAGVTPKNELIGLTNTVDGWRPTNFGTPHPLERIFVQWNQIDPSVIPQPNTIKVTDDSPSIATPTPHDYSAFPHFFHPRGWTPAVSASADRFSLGYSILFFDRLGDHQLLGSAGYDFITKTPQLLLNYGNRQTSVTINPYFESGPAASFQDESGLILDQSFWNTSLTASIPIPIRFGEWSPGIGVDYRKAFIKFRDINGASLELFDRTLVKASINLLEQIGSPLGISNESGRRFKFEIGYVHSHNLLSDESGGTGPSQQHVRAILSHAEYISLGNHFVWTPQVAAGGTSRAPSTLGQAFLIRGPGNNWNQTTYDQSQHGLDGITVRGYSLGTQARQWGAYFGSELRLPISNVFQGSGFFPVFLKNISTMLFAETARIESAWMPSAGLAVRTTLDIGYVLPLRLSLELHQGFAANLGGQTEFLFTLSGLNLPGF